MTLPRLETTGRVGDQVFEAIRGAIIGGELPAGHRLRIRDLADELGTSVMPVREAIRRLEEIGLAEALPYRGAVVKEFTDTELLDLYAVRRTLEIDASERGTPRLTDAAIARMDEQYAAMEKAIAARDAVEYLSCDEEFLATVYSASGNAVLLEMIRTLWQRCSAYKIVGARRELDSGDPASLLKHQADLLDAAREGDGEAAARITATSLDAATARIGQALRAPATSA